MDTATQFLGWAVKSASAQCTNRDGGEENQNRENGENLKIARTKGPRRVHQVDGDESTRAQAQDHVKGFNRNAFFGPKTHSPHVASHKQKAGCQCKYECG